MTNNPYRTHTCIDLTAGDVGTTVTLSGWIHRKRDHGGLLFIDLRDTFGLTQCVIDTDHPQFAEVESWRVESVITVEGEVIARSPDTVNDKLPTGAIEVGIKTATLQSAAKTLPFQVATDDGAGEDLRLQYRFLDLRRDEMQKKIRLRNEVIAFIRNKMWDMGFQEFQTPILTASSPEGARDFLVPSRLHPGKFYALPQAPQQFKQLLMMSGFDKYFQIAPCFRDEDARADRSPTDFYQLDVEMSFVTQEDVFNAIEPLMRELFEKFSDFTDENRVIPDAFFPRIPYKEAMLRYGSDKPDLRNPLEIFDVTEIFARDDVEFKAFKGVIEKGGVVRAIKAPGTATFPRSYFDKLNDWARGEGAPGLGYIQFLEGSAKGPIAKFLSEHAIDVLRENTDHVVDGDSLFFVCDKPSKAEKFAGRAREAVCDAVTAAEPDHASARERGTFRFCWIVDFPMYEKDEDTGKIDFSHNPFSMPQGGMDDFDTKDLLDILAYQYDIVCNGYELSSGAIRNHKPEIMEKAFEAVGYGKAVLEEKFGGMLKAMQYGAPPHGGIAPGIDRIVMLLADQHNIREVTVFPTNNAGEDLMMGAPSNVDEAQLKDLHIKLNLPKEVVKKSEAA